MKVFFYCGIFTVLLLFALTYGLWWECAFTALGGVGGYLLGRVDGEAEEVQSAPLYCEACRSRRRVKREV